MNEEKKGRLSYEYSRGGYQFGDHPWLSKIDFAKELKAEINPEVLFWFKDWELFSNGDDTFDLEVTMKSIEGVSMTADKKIDVIAELQHILMDIIKSRDPEAPTDTEEEHAANRQYNMDVVMQTVMRQEENKRSPKRKADSVSSSAPSKKKQVRYDVCSSCTKRWKDCNCLSRCVSCQKLWMNCECGKGFDHIMCPVCFQVGAVCVCRDRCHACRKSHRECTCYRLIW